MGIQIINASATLEYPESKEQALSDMRRIEKAGRTCYKSEDKCTDISHEGFIKMIIGRGHDSVLEHALASFRIICDRGVSHELVRHRIGMSYSQESTRYVNYAKKPMSFINVGAFDMSPAEILVWQESMIRAAKDYTDMIAEGAPPELARGVLPNSVKTELVMTGTLRAWRHFLTLRTSQKAHPQMREVAEMIKAQLVEFYPPVFGNLA